MDAERAEPLVQLGTGCADRLGVLGKAFGAPAVSDRTQQGDEGGRGGEDDVLGEGLVEQRGIGLECGVEERIGRYEQHDEFRAGDQPVWIVSVGEAAHVLTQVPRVAAHERAVGRLVGGLHGFEPRREGHFRVDRDLLAVRQRDDDIRPLGAGLPDGVHLLGEVHVLESSGGFDDPPELHLAPAPPHLRSAQRRYEPVGVGAQVGVVPAHSLHLREQPPVRPFPMAFDGPQVFVHPVECRVHRLQQHSDVTGARVPRAHPVRAPGEQPACEDTERSADAEGEHDSCHASSVRQGSDIPGAGNIRRVGLSIGIVGLPNVGKSTLFNALTRASVLAANYPFATIEPNVGIVPVPEPRLHTLAELYDSAREVPATVEFVDIAGIVRGASEGQGLGNQFLAHIREADAICQVLRAFHDPDVVHVDGRVDPLADVETVNTELILADLQTLDSRLPRLEREVKGDKGRAPVLEAARAARAALDNGQALVAAEAIDLPALHEFFLLTAKPFIYVLNVDESQLGDPAVAAPILAALAPSDVVALCAKVEAELVELPPDEAAELLASYGQEVSGLAQLARIGFHTLGLQTYLTAGPKEARAWTIPVGATAPQAAGVIHSDFERGFIKAEIVSYEDLVTAGSVPAARAVGKARIEGKDYVMRDGDVVEFRFNV